MNVCSQLVFLKRAFISRRVCVAGSFCGCFKINTNPLNIIAHVCINRYRRCPATRPHKEIRQQESWMTWFCIQFQTGSVDNSPKIVQQTFRGSTAKALHMQTYYMPRCPSWIQCRSHLLILWVSHYIFIKTGMNLKEI